VLGIEQGASEAVINEARRRLAKRAHPDVGGSVESMQRINQAAELALRSLSVPRSDAGPVFPARTMRGESPSRVRRDHPSFTVEALPVETFEGLLVVASWLGDVIADDQPYGLEVALLDPIRCWCRLDLVPDAGASTVSLTVAAEPGYPSPDVDEVRDLWVSGLNQLDWAGLAGDGPGPLLS
jgi:hypothetical protein